MTFRTVVRDCLYLNWALPQELLPALDAALRYDTVSWQGRSWVFASAALFRLEGLRLRSLPLPRISYPQFTLRLCVVDADGVPSFLLQSVLIPAWALPGLRWVARQRALSGSFLYPRPGSAAAGEARRWRVRRRHLLALEARPASPRAGAGPDLGSWQETVAYFDRRRLGYYAGRGGLGRVESERARCPAVPVQAEIQTDRLLLDCLGAAPGEAWPALHSAWLCAEQTFRFELGTVRDRTLPRHVPAPG